MRSYTPGTRPVSTTIFPIVGLILAMAAAITIMLFVSAREVDRQYAIDAASRTKLVLENLQTDVSTTALDYAWWDEAYENLHVTFSPEWAESTFSQSTVLGADKAVDGVLVIGPDNALLFGKWHGEALDPAAVEELRQGAAELADGARGAVAGNGNDPAQGPAPKAGYLVHGGVVALAGAVAVTPYEKPELAGLRSGQTVLLMVRTLTPEYLAMVGSVYGIADLRIDPAQSPAPTPLAAELSKVGEPEAAVAPQLEGPAGGVALPAPDGAPLGQLNWAPAAPGKALIATLAPGALLGFLVLGAIGLVVLYQILDIRRVTQEQFKVIEARNDALRQSAQMLGATIQGIEDGIAVFDSDRKLKHWNRAYMDMWQFPEDFLRSGVGMTDMLDELMKGGRVQLMVRDDHGNPATDPKAFEPAGRWLYRRSDGRQIAVRRIPIGDDGYMAVCSDLTAQKQHEDELVKAWEQAVIANRSKSEFLANVSHELRTPLNAIIGFSEVVERELFGPLGNERYVSYVRDIRNSGEHLLSLINDILDLSKIEAGRFQLRMEEVDCNEIAHSVARLIRPRTVEHGLTMVMDLPEAPILLNADKRAVKQVLINLLSNAVKFTPESGTVTLGCKSWQDGVEFTVSDTGIGIDEKEMHVALSPFGQIDSQFNRKYEGTGLGLPIVKGIVELHGGTLEIKSQPGKGTTVVVRFPNHPPEQPTAEIVPLPRKQAAIGH
jgi:signal transduction histidine kinase/sensor domain CHASE-containing protein